MCDSRIIALSTLVLFMNVFPFTVTGKAAEEIPWEWSPYRIRVHFSISESACYSLDCKDTPEAIERLRPGLMEVVWNWAGGLWELDFCDGEFPEELFFDNALKEEIPLSDEHLRPFLADAYDKFVYVTITSQPQGLLVRTREIDLATFSVHGNRRFELRRSEDLPRTLFSAMLSSFSPIALVDRVLEEKVTLRLRGGELMPKSSSVTENPFRIIERGAVFVPYLKIRTKSGEPDSVKPIPWTALLVDSVEGNFVRCTLETGIRHPLTIRRRGRTEQIAVLFRLEEKPTLLRLQPRMQSAKPAENEEPNESESDNHRRVTFLPSYEIFETLGETNERISLGKTARDGTLLVPFRDGNPVRRIYIKEGEILIARVPIIQGWKSSFSIGLPDDQVRLEAERFLMGIQEELIDQIAYREILASRIKHFEKTGRDKAALEKARMSLHSLKSRLQFQTEIENARRRYTSADPIVQRRIDKMFSTTQKIIDQFLPSR